MGQTAPKPSSVATRVAALAPRRIGGAGINNMNDFKKQYVHSFISVQNKKNENEKCVITGAKVSAKIANFVAEVDLEMRFENTTGQPMEAVFKFLTTNEVMYGFEVRVAGKTIKGVCKEKQEARREYDDAIASGKGAYLAEENATDKRKSFDILVGNLPNLGSCTVKISYAQELSHEGKAIIFALPQTSAFGAASKPATKDSDSDALEGFRFDAELIMGSNIVKLEGGSDCKCSFKGNKGKVKSKVAPQGSRLELRVELEDPSVSSAIVENLATDPKDKAIMLSMFPSVDTEVDTVTEMIFLIDRSGSMSSKIYQVRNAMHLFLRSIPANTRFNIVGFGSTHRLLFPKSEPYNDAIMAKAITHVSGMYADMGGTELFTPLKAVMSVPVDPKYPRQIFVLTDGAVSNAGLVLDYVRDNIGMSTRIFTLGIGSGASEVLVQGIAHLGNGLARSVGNNARLEQPIMALVNRALTPIIVDIEPYWGDFTVLPRPIDRVTRPVFDGQKLVAFDFLDSSAVQPDSGSVVVKMVATTSAGEKITYTASVDVASATVEGKSIHRLAAMSIIRDLEMAENRIEAETGTTDKYKEQIVERALKYTVASKHTSFVAIEERDEPVLDAMKNVDVSKQLGEKNMDEIANERIGAPPPAEAEEEERHELSNSDLKKDKKAEAPMREERREMSRKKMAAPSKSSSMSSSFAKSKRMRSHYDADEEYTPESSSPFYAVVMLATAAGSFKCDETFASTIGSTLEKIKESQPSELKEKDSKFRLWVTLLAIAFMKHKSPQEEEEWGLLFRKSKKWILSKFQKHNMDAKAFDSLFAAATKFVSQ